MQNILCPVLRCLRTVHVNLVCPLKGGGNQGHSAVYNAEHTADTGGFPALSVGNDRGSAHTQGGHKIDVTGHDGQIAGGGADNEPLGAAVVDQAVRGDDFQGEGAHAFSPPRYFSTTSSMEPANRK